MISGRFVSVFRLYHTFRPRCGDLGRMSARDRWRYERSLARFRANYGDPTPIPAGEIGVFHGIRIISSPQI